MAATKVETQHLPLFIYAVLCRCYTSLNLILFVKNQAFALSSSTPGEWLYFKVKKLK